MSSAKASARLDPTDGARWVGAIVSALLAVFATLFTLAQGTGAEAAPGNVLWQVKPTDPEPIEASLVVHMDAPIGIGGPGSQIYLRVGAVGAPFEGTVTLRDEAGVNVANARAIHPASKCRLLPRHLAVRDIPRGVATSRQDWCLAISGLEIGSEVSGELPGSDTALTLTLAARHNFFFLPFLVTLIGGAAAVGAAFITRWLRRYLRETHIDLLVQRSRRSRSRRVRGLMAWVATMRRRRVPDEDLAPVVERIVEDGPERMQASRRSLDEFLRGSGIPPGSPLYASARREADRKDYAIDDLVDARGKEKQVPADAKVESLKRAVHLAQEIEEAEGRARRLPSPTSTELLKRLAVLRTIWAEAKDDDDLEELAEAIREFRPHLHRALETLAVLDSDQTTGERELLAPPPPPGLPVPSAAQEEPRGGRRLVPALIAGVLIAGLLLVAIPTLILRNDSERAAAPPPLEAEPGEPNGGAPSPSITGSNGDGQIPAPSPLPSPLRPAPSSLPVLPVTLIAGVLLAVGLLVPLAFGRIAFAIAITAELIALAAAVFITAVAVSTYAPNPTFGRPTDYYTLVTAATSSGALGGVFGMLTYWKATGQGTR